MGLDMYLYRRNHLTEEQETELKEAKAMIEAYDKLYDEETSAARRVLWAQREVEWQDKISNLDDRTEVAYWRKANAIHRWFEKRLYDRYNVECLENCGEYVVDAEDLRDLVVDCKTVLREEGNDHFEKVASSILPTESGFFFGSTEYGDWYLSDLRQTVEMLEPLLESDDAFVYMAWW